MAAKIQEPYIEAANRLLGEGFVFDARTCCYERGLERLKLRWNGKVYARRHGPPKPQEPAQEFWGRSASPEILPLL